MRGDLIRRVDAINGIMDAMMINTSHYEEIFNTGLRRAASRIDSLPAADAVEVVRCRECAFYTPLGKNGELGLCGRVRESKGRHREWYCAGGVRTHREENDA